MDANVTVLSDMTKQYLDVSAGARQCMPFYRLGRYFYILKIYWELQ